MPVSKQKSFVTKLQKMYGILVGRDSNNSVSELKPAQYDKDKDKLTAVNFKSEIQKLWDYWIRSVHDNPASIKNRLDRYKDLDYMYYNDPIISRAIELYADETVQFDSQTQPLIINAKNKKVASYINDFFEKIGINRQSLREIARSLSLFGDSFCVTSLKEGTGYTYCQVVDVTAVKERIEFNAITVKKEMARLYGLQNMFNRENSLMALAKELEDQKDQYDVSNYYKSYLFGYKIEDDLYLPPWAVLHFRLYSSKSEFYPFGRPILINSISPFRQLKASMNLMALARAAKFPKEKYTVKTTDEMTQADKWNAVNMAKQEFQNLSKSEGSKEDFAVGGAIWTSDDLLGYELMVNNINIDDIADIELLRENEIIGTGIPKGYIVSDRGSMFGQSGQALLQQYKPFGRSVLTVQTAILEQLVQLVKQQFIISGDYKEDEPFELAMNYPIIEDSKDRIEMKSTTLQLAKTVVDNLKDVLGINSKLPADVIKDIYKKYSFLGGEDVDDWVDRIEKENEKLSESDQTKIKERLNEGLIREVYFAAKKQLHLTEHISNGYHYMTSYSSDPMNERVLETLKKKPIRKRI